MSTVLTSGCRLKACESDAIGAMVTGRAGGINNTRAVTAVAERTARAAIRGVVREQPGVPITVAGCAPTLYRAAWAALPGGTRVVPNAAKLHPITSDARLGPAARVRVRAATASGLVV